MKKTLPIVLFIFIVITACGLSQAVPTETPTAVVTSPPSPTTPPESRSLAICLGQEPNTLYPLGELNAAARSVLAAVNDGPIDMVGYDYQPVAITRMPSFENGDAEIVSTLVQVGGQVVDADGNLVVLDNGIRVRPAGCRGDDCVITYDGSSPLEMDQMVVNFSLRPDLTWADGTPVTADDSVYAFTLASDPNAVVKSFLAERTQIYEAADPQTIQWWGKPGFIDPAYFTNIWPPAPKHLWGDFSAADLPNIDIASRSPIGWGPYMIEEWIEGDHITMTKNPYYFRAADGYPKFDTLSFRFIEDPNMALSEMVAGRCDILDPTIRLDNHAGLLQEMQSGEQAQAFFVSGMTIEWLGLGITPASYDDGYEPVRQGDRQDVFGDAHTRQGIAYCLDREGVVKDALYGLTTVPATYIPVGHPLYDTNIDALPYNPETGISLLEQAGWRDVDGDPSTPITAVNVTNVTPGTPLQLNYYTTTATQRRQVVDILEKSLAQCGIGLNVEYFSQNDLYSPGPDGFLFGRNFDLIEYAMGVDGIEPPCGWFTTDEIPTSSNSWIGTNVTAYKNKDFDTACRSAQLSLPDEPSYLESYRQTQVLFSTELPAIPLYYRLRIAAARPDLCHFDLDATANPLWNIEAFDMGEACRN
ncbi:MAG TPA: ABC transporter substrate-binding protein [Anaerolineales bacterium]|nr:ABC transporter substrate-binding protein [Anaerolineales bacterium]